MPALQRLSAEDGQAVYDMLQQIGRNENGFTNSVHGMPYADYLAWLRDNEDFALGENLPDGWVPMTTYWLMDGDTPVGCGRIRHYLNDALRIDGGHIGYAIAKPYRGKGFGNALLPLLLEECRAMGIEEVHIGANKDNLPSNRVILHSGGKLLRQTETKNHYTIALK